MRSSELLVDAPILAVRRDSVVMPGGHAANREIVEHFGAVAVVALRNDGAIKMIHQYRHAVGQHFWEIPAGLLDVAHEDPLSAAQRELVEEAGLAAAQWQLLVDVTPSPGFSDETVRVYLATDLREVPRPQPDEEEAEMGERWIPLADARAMVFAGEIHNSTALAAILAAAAVVDGYGTTRSADTPFALRPRALAGRRQAEGVLPDMKKR